MRKIRVAGLGVAAVAALGGALLVTHTASADENTALSIEAGPPLVFGGADEDSSSVRVGLAGADPLDELLLEFTLPGGLEVDSVNKSDVCGQVVRGVQRCRPAPPEPGTTEFYGFSVTTTLDEPRGVIRVRAIGSIDGQRPVQSSTVSIDVQP